MKDPLWERITYTLLGTVVSHAIAWAVTFKMWRELFQD